MSNPLCYDACMNANTIACPKCETEIPLSETIHPPEMIRIPRIRRLKLENVGLWRNLNVNFHSRLTVIKCPVASGATTLVTALAAVAAGDLPSSIMRRNQPLRLEAIWESNRLTLELPLASHPPELMDARCSRTIPAAGERMLLAVRAFLSVTADDYAAVFDEDCVACLDHLHWQDYWNLLTKVNCQVVALIPDGIPDHSLPSKHIGACFRVIKTADGSVIESLPLADLPVSNQI